MMFSLPTKYIFIEKITGKMNLVVLMFFKMFFFPIDPTFSLMFDGCFEEINFSTPSLVSFNFDHKSCHNSRKCGYCDSASESSVHC